MSYILYSDSTPDKLGRLLQEKSLHLPSATIMHEFDYPDTLQYIQNELWSKISDIDAEEKTKQMRNLFAENTHWKFNEQEVPIERVDPGVFTGNNFLQFMHYNELKYADITNLLGPLTYETIVAIGALCAKDKSSGVVGSSWEFEKEGKTYKRVLEADVHHDLRIKSSDITTYEVKDPFSVKRLFRPNVSKHNYLLYSYCGGGLDLLAASMKLYEQLYGPEALQKTSYAHLDELTQGEKLESIDQLGASTLLFYAHNNMATLRRQNGNNYKLQLDKTGMHVTNKLMFFAEEAEQLLKGTLSYLHSHRSYSNLKQAKGMLDLRFSDEYEHIIK
jgi:hypothetical protein